MLRFALFFLCLLATNCYAEKRVALIIGNTAYQNLVPLINPARDARALADLLKSNGYQVLEKSDLTREQFLDTLEEFRHVHLPGATHAVMFYAGHGMAADGGDILAPVDLTYECDEKSGEAQIRRPVSWAEVERSLRDAPNLVVILDACRENPFKHCVKRGGGGNGFRSLSQTARSGTLTVNSTAMGALAADGPPGKGSPFAQALIKRLEASPDVDFRELFDGVAGEVAEVTGGRQVPEVLVRGASPRACLSGNCKKVEFSSISDEEVAWRIALASNRLEEYQAYSSRWPGGTHKNDAAEKTNNLLKLSASWKELEGKRDFQTLSAFIIGAAGTEFESLARFKQAELGKIEADAWERTDNVRELVAYETFLKTWPDGPHRDAAIGRRDELYQIRDAWHQIRASENESELQTFVGRYGWSEFGAEATARLVSIRQEKKLPRLKSIATLSAEEMAQILDGASLSFPSTGETIAFASSAMPSYRVSLGKDFLKQQLRQTFAREGVFQADITLTGRRSRIGGLGGIIKSKVDGTGSLFLIEMTGAEKTMQDVDNKDRNSATFQIIRDNFGYVCIGTTWQSTLSQVEPAKTVERCTIHR